MMVDGDKKKKCFIVGSVLGLLVIMVVFVVVVIFKYIFNEN